MNAPAEVERRIRHHVGRRRTLLGQARRVDFRSPAFADEYNPLIREAEGAHRDARALAAEWETGR